MLATVSMQADNCKNNLSALSFKDISGLSFELGNRCRHKATRAKDASHLAKKAKAKISAIHISIRTNYRRIKTVVRRLCAPVTYIAGQWASMYATVAQ